MLWRVCGSLPTLLGLGAARLAADDVIELVLNDQEASQGGMVTISMHVPVRFGADRTIEELYSAWLAIPPGVADGALLAPSAQLTGMLRPVSFRVRTSS